MYSPRKRCGDVGGVYFYCRPLLSVGMSMDELSKATSRHLRNFMTEHGITQQQVADKIGGRTQGYVSQRTNGRSVLPLDIIEAVARLAGIRPESLMTELALRLQEDSRR